MELKRESLVILLLAVFTVGWVTGRVMTKNKYAAEAEAGGGAVAVAPAAAPTAPAAPAPAAAPAPTPAATPAPKPAAAATARPAPTTAKPAPPPPPEKTWKVELFGDEPTEGPDDALVKVVVFSAFGCKECIDFAPHLDTLRRDYAGKVQVIFKQKVYDAPHPNALIASEAALAAHAQGRFWEFHDVLMNEAKFNIDRDALEGHAQKLGLNMSKFRAALDNGTYRKQAFRDGLGAYEVGAHSFPNVLANGVRMPKPKNWTSLQKLVDAQLVRAEGLLKGGATKENLYAKAISGGKQYPQVAPKKGSSRTEGRPFKGPANAKMTMVVYEDFECPFCTKANPNLQTFLDRFPKDVKMVFKHFPLSNIHPNAQLASEAAAEAHAQGRFWEYHDKLFANQKALTRSDLDRYASEVGLDMARFKAALDNGTHKATVREDLADGQRLGVTGTPTVFLNDQKYQGPRGYNPDGLEGVARVHLGL